MNFKKFTCKWLSVLMTLVMCFSFSIPAYASSSIPTSPYCGMDFSTGHSFPICIIKGPDGKLYVSDYSGHKIVNIDTDGQNMNTVTSSTSQPIGLAFDTEGTLFIGEHSGSKVSKVTTESTYSDVKPSLGLLTGLVIDSNEKIFAVSYGSGKIYKMDKEGTNFSEFKTGLTTISLIGMAIDGDDNLYIADRSNNRVIKVTPEADVTNFITGVSYPTWVTLGKDGFFYVSQGNRIIKKVDSTGTAVAEFSTGIYSPWGTYVDRCGYIYFTENSSSIKKIVGSASTTDATHISLTMNTLLDGDEANPSAFTITGVASNPSVISAEIYDDTITLTLNKPITNLDTNIKVSYEQKGLMDLTTPELHGAGSDYKLDNFTGMGVINNVSPNQNQAAPSGLTGVAPTFANGTGKITGTTTAMEFKAELADDSTYTTCSANETTATPSTYLVRFKAKTGYNAGATASVTVPQYVPGNQNQAAPTGLVGVKPTSAQNNDGKITGTTTDMEFKLSSANDSTYVTCSEVETIVPAPATYSVRFKAKTGFNAGAVASVTVSSYVAPGKNNNDDDSTSTSGGGSVTTKPVDNIVLVNGKEEKAGTETKLTVNGSTEVTLKVDSSAVSKKIEEVLENKTDNSQNLIAFTVSSGNSATVALTGDVVKQLEKSEFNVSITKDNVEYVIPAAEITIQNVANILNVNSDKLKDIEVEVRINEVSADVLAKYNEIANRQEHVLVAPPVEFEIVAKATGTDGVTRETTISQFSNYVERIIEMPANVDPSKITTGIVFNPDGTYSHVPTVVFQKDGKYYAKLNSLTNSTYSVIYNPITVTSVEGHWAEEIVNDMASRLVLVDYTNFDPDKAVTRAEFADYIVRALGLYREGEKLDSTFTDLETGSKYQISIEKAKEWGIISGYPDGTFKADKTVSREEAMVMYATAMDIADILENRADKLNTYKDKEDVSSWATSSVRRVVNSQIFNGKGEGILAPKDTLTKAEALTAVRNLLLQAELINK